MKNSPDPTLHDFSLEDSKYEETLRPGGLKDFSGQSSLVERLKVAFEDLNCIDRL